MTDAGPKQPFRCLDLDDSVDYNDAVDFDDSDDYNDLVTSDDSQMLILMISTWRPPPTLSSVH